MPAFDSRAIQPYVVRLIDETGGTLGTGFFVGAGLVLTSAHVAEGRERVAVVAACRSTPAPARVVAATATPEAPAGGLWPYPDLAVLRLDVDVEHPVAPLSGEDPVGGTYECHSWGYQRREYGRQPPGSPVSFFFEGVEGDGFLKLKAGQAVPGLSGAPLICTGRRAVVGVVCGTRGESDDLGGYASPVRALLAEQPAGRWTSTGDVRTVRRSNRALALRDRRAWNEAVSGGHRRDVLRQDWAPFRRVAGSTPVDLLLPGFGVVPYLFRDEDLDEAGRWCEEDLRPAAVSWLSAAGGTGKSRFAVELCRRMEARGWVAGTWTGDRAVLDVPLPRLVVVEDAQRQDPRELGDLVAALQAGATDFAPVRVLFLERVERAVPAGAERVRAAAGPRLRQVLDQPARGRAARLLPADQQRSLFQEAVRSFGVAWGPAPPPARMPATRAPATPLAVLLEALDCVLSGADYRPDAGRPATARVLDHLADHWVRTLPDELADLGRACLAALAVTNLAGFETAEEADELLALIPELRGPARTGLRTRVAAWIRQLSPGGTA